MSGICVAVKATTSTSGLPRNATLKLWKSRPAAPAMRMRRGTAGEPSKWIGGRPPSTDALLHASDQRVQVQLVAGQLADELLGRHALALAPQLAEERARLALREPRRPELVAEEVAHLRLERPRAKVGGGVEAGVHVAEVV